MATDLSEGYIRVGGELAPSDRRSPSGEMAKALDSGGGGCVSRKSQKIYKKSSVYKGENVELKSRRILHTS